MSSGAGSGPQSEYPALIGLGTRPCQADLREEALARHPDAEERKFLLDRLSAIEQQRAGLLAEAKAIRRRLGTSM